MRRSEWTSVTIAIARITLATAVTGGLMLGCATNRPEPSQEAPALLPSLQVYVAADTVHFVLQVTNTTEAPIELDFRNGQMFDFVVSSGSGEVWRWSEGVMFTQALQTDRLEPGESRRYEAAWGPPAGVAGEYQATGVLTASNHRVEQSTRIVLP